MKRNPRPTSKKRRTPTIPLDAVRLGRWLLEHGNPDQIGGEGPKTIIRALVEFQMYGEAAAFVATLLPSPIVFAECAITLVEVLCEHGWRDGALEFVHLFEGHMDSQEHTFKPSDLYLAVAETTNIQADIKRAIESVRAEPDEFERIIRLTRLTTLDRHNSEHAKNVREFVTRNMTDDPERSAIAAYNLFLATHKEFDLRLFCEVVRRNAEDAKDDVRRLLLRLLYETFQRIPMEDTMRIIQDSPNDTVSEWLQATVCSQTAPTRH